jgi:hypothetical protein
MFGLPRESWHRDRAQLQRVGMRGPLNWYRGATKRLRPRRVSVPTLYIWGRRDPFLGRRAAELTANYVTGDYRFEELNAGHWIPDRNAGDLQRLLGDHLRRHRAAPQTAGPAPDEAPKPRARTAPRAAAKKKATTTTNISGAATKAAAPRAPRRRSSPS